MSAGTYAEPTAEEGVRDLLVAIGEDPNREGLVETPARVVRAFLDMTGGYQDDPREILAKTFDVGAVDQMVVLADMEFTSLCEHHLLSFSGVAKIGYVPRDRVVGISKLARLLECYGRRLQVQERLTNQIADAIETYLSPIGVGVVLEATHSCMSCRGVRKSARMVTCALKGVLRTDPSSRAEFLAL